jgi:hypothetical protein
MFKAVERRNSFVEDNNTHEVKLHLFCSQRKKMEAYGYIKCLKKIKALKYEEGDAVADSDSNSHNNNIRSISRKN